MNEATTDSNSWWGERSLQSEQIAHWDFGPLTVQVCRYEKEWRILTDHRINEQIKNDWRFMIENVSLPDDSETRRHLFTKTSDRLVVNPALPDRPMVVKPAHPFSLHSGQETLMYVSSPLWLRIQVGDPLTILDEIPIQRPSDTWFGPSTREGQLCYAARTHARVQLDQMSLKPYRAMSSVKIRNEHKDALVVDRLCLPVEYLSLYLKADGLLWTQPVSMVKDIDGEIAALELSKISNSDKEYLSLVSNPRKKPERHIIEKAFSELFG